MEQDLPFTIRIDVHKAQDSQAAQELSEIVLKDKFIRELYMEEWLMCSCPQLIIWETRNLLAQGTWTTFIVLIAFAVRYHFRDNVEGDPGSNFGNRTGNLGGFWFV